MQQHTFAKRFINSVNHLSTPSMAEMSLKSSLLANEQFLQYVFWAITCIHQLSLWRNCQQWWGWEPIKPMSDDKLRRQSQEHHSRASLTARMFIHRGRFLMKKTIHTSDSPKLLALYFFSVQTSNLIKTWIHHPTVVRFAKRGYYTTFSLAGKCSWATTTKVLKAQ